jgi:hypothetical protein
MEQGENLVLALGSTQQYSREGEVYGIKACIDKNIDKGYRNMII